VAEGEDLKSNILQGLYRMPHQRAYSTTNLAEANIRRDSAISAFEALFA
jgi:hypothetical protein